MKIQRKQLIFIQLNEVNFDVVAQYVASCELPGFKRLLGQFQRMETFAEEKYEQLEPWIQWVSVHTGKRFDQHRVFRLGDIVNCDMPQIFEILESSGLKVGAISPMNASNRLARPAFFVPDPWTKTESDGTGFSKRLTEMLRQTVNENSNGTVTTRSFLTIAEAAIRSFSILGTTRLVRLITASRTRTWQKSLVLDQLVHLVHLYLVRRTRPDVSFVFLNAGAHIQHHYYLNSPHSGGQLRNPTWYVAEGADPILDMIKVYDDILLDYLSMVDRGEVELIVATGLTQISYSRVKFYYRLKSHQGFLGALGLSPVQVLPRMTRDFEITFADHQQTLAAGELLASVKMVRDSVPLFGEIENRGGSLFVTLTYPSEIHANDRATFNGGEVNNLLDHVVFVAIKNGMHSGKGFAFMSPSLAGIAPSAPVHVAALFGITLAAAGATCQATAPGMT